MRARNAYELIVTRGGAVDQVEVVDVADGEVVLFWDTLPSQTGRLARALREDLVGLQAQDFMDKWRRYDPGA